MRHATRLAAIALVLAAGCSSGNSSDPAEDAFLEAFDVTVPRDDIPPCDELTGVIAHESGDLTCREPDGDLHLHAVMKLDCPDGRTLYWNDRVWGYYGEPATQDHGPLDEAQAACR